MAIFLNANFTATFTFPAPQSRFLDFLIHPGLISRVAAPERLSTTRYQIYVSGLKSSASAKCSLFPKQKNRPKAVQRGTLKLLILSRSGGVADRH